MLRPFCFLGSLDALLMEHAQNAGVPFKALADAIPETIFLALLPALAGCATVGMMKGTAAGRRVNSPSMPAPPIPWSRRRGGYQAGTPGPGRHQHGRMPLHVS